MIDLTIRLGQFLFGAFLVALSLSVTLAGLPLALLVFPVGLAGMIFSMIP